MGRCNMGLMALFAVILTWCDVGEHGTEAAEIKLAWMATRPLMFNLFNASTSLGALAHSVETIQNDANSLPGYTFDIRYKDSACDAKQAVGSMFDYLEDESWVPDVFLGPICSGAMQPVAEVASYLNKPVFGWISSDPPLADKSIYTTLVRFLWPINNLGEGLVLLLNKFNWKRVFLISTTGGDYGELGRGLREVLLQQGDFTVSRWVQDVEENPTSARIQSIYDQVRREARIVILCTPLDEVRDWALAAYNSNMHKGDFVFLYTNQQTATQELYDRIIDPDWLNIDDDSEVRQALSNFFLMLAKTQQFDLTNSFLADFKTAANSNGWPTRIPSVPPADPGFYSLFLYDALRVYSRFATETGSINDGSVLFNAARGSLTTGGATGDIVLDDACDRIPDYYIFKLTAENHFDVVASTVTMLNDSTLIRNLDITGDIIWGDGETGEANAPLDTPVCGFDNENCPNLVLNIVPPVVVVVLIIAGGAAFVIYRKISYERDLANMTWKLDYDEINIYTGVPGAASFRAQSMQLRKSNASIAESTAGQMYVTAGNYRGNTVALKVVHKTKVDLDRRLKEEMRAMQEAQHSNLNTFMGACTVAPHIVCVWDYCIKGSLQDVIWNDNIQLDDMFKFSICIDILKGLAYLHESKLRVHGRLKSSNVLIDGRWVCKLTDYGLNIFTEGQAEDPEISDHAKMTKLLWLSPEALREVGNGAEDEEGEKAALPPSMYSATTPAADMYAVGIIIKEVMCRNGPYTEHEDVFTQLEILMKIKHPAQNPDGQFRPSLTNLHEALQTGTVVDKLKRLICELWAEDPKSRPQAPAALKAMSKINPFKKTNVMDNMIAMMEKHAKHLEAVVAERTGELEEEKKKTEDLLYRMLPKKVTDDLKAGKTVQAETFDSVTIYFSDIDGFAELASECSPLEVVDILNGVYTLFDEIVERHNVYKVETVSDVYVLVSGLPVLNGDRHVVEICNCALDIMSGMMTFKVPHKPTHRMRIRIGVHTGTIVTGVVGLTMPRFCLFGDTMNTTSRMESHGAPMRIHLSPTAFEALSKFSGYLLADRGEIDVKGKGRMNTFWLLGHNDFNEELPDFNSQFMNDKPPPWKMAPTSGKPMNPKVVRPSKESGFSETMPAVEMVDENLLSPGHITKGDDVIQRQLTPVDTRSDVAL